jgi:Na+/H+-dicarboxylate symporter
MLSMVFVQVGLPVEGIGLILGVDRLLDMIRTSVNVTGDAVVSTVVAKRENALDLERYQDREAGLVEVLEIDEEIEEEFAEVVHSVEAKS